MVFRADKQELIGWYKHVLEQRRSGLSPSEYCRKNKLFPGTFNNKRWRFFNCQKNNPQQYQIYLEACKRFQIKKENDRYLTSKLFCIENNLVLTKFVEFLAHMNYLKLAEEFLVSEPDYRTKELVQKKQESNFIQLKAPVKQEIAPVVEQLKEHEIIEAQNDLEIQITKGVKVLVSPQIDSAKILKIIQLLRDL